MSPAQRRYKIRQKKKKKASLLKRLSLFLLPLVVLVFLLSWTRFWDGESKLVLVINRPGKEVLLSVFDPKVDKITTLKIPSSTQVRVARQLGTWKLGSVWQLGENESLEGILLAETVTYYFKLPVVAWADVPAEGFVGAKVISLVKALTYPYKTNLKVGDRMALALFSFRVKNFKREEIDLSRSLVLKRQKLVGGEVGYVLVGSMPANIAALFSDLGSGDKGTLVAIKDLTGKKGVAEKVGEIVEVLGAKVVAIAKEEASDFDCEVVGKDKREAKKLRQVFACLEGPGQPSGDLDLEIKIGRGFAKRF